MTNNELITLARREADRLEQENDHGASIIMRSLVERLQATMNDRGSGTLISRSGVLADAIGTLRMPVMSR